MSSKSKAYPAVICGMIVNMLATMVFTTLGLIAINVVEKIGIPYERFSFVYTFVYIGMMIGAAFAGKVVMKADPRIVEFLVGVAAFIFVYTSCTVTSLVPIFAAALFFGFFEITAFMYLNIMCTQWFRVGSGTLIGIGTAVGVLGMMIGAPLLANLFEKIGYIAAGKGMAWFLLITIGASAILLAKKAPASYGLEPINFGKEKQGKESKKRKEYYEAEMPSGRAARTSAFWMVAATALFTGFAINSFSNNQYFIFGEFGLDTVQSAYYVSLIGLCGAIGPIIIGTIADIFGQRVTFVGAALITGGMYLAGFTAGGAAGCLILSLASISGGYDKLRPSVLLSRLFGSKISPDLISWDGILVSVGSMIAAPLSANIVAVTGTYRTVGYIGILFFAISAVLFFLVTSDSTREKIKKIDEPYRNQGKNA